ncbi:outer membrane protein assembly factor BamC [Halomonas sp. PA5]|nr:outer membrane protein assembly factor BamC [Halomonas sp. PA5]
MPLAVSVMLVVAGCSRDGYYHDRNIDYTTAQPSRPLVLPDTRDLSRYRDAMPIPEARNEFVAPEGRFRVPRPDAVASGSQHRFVERRDAGQEGWLIIDAEPGSVWPQLEDFARRQGLGIVSSDPAQGVLTTDQGTLRVRSGLRSGVSEVRCEQGGVTQPQCLDALDGYLMAESQTASASALASQRQRASERQESVRLERSGDEWYMTVDADAQRVWSELGYQLERNFVEESRQLLLESNADTRDFLIEYMTVSERNRGAFSIVFSADVRQTAQWLRLALEETGPERTEVRVINESNKPLSAEDSRELLDTLAAMLR